MYTKILKPYLCIYFSFLSLNLSCVEISLGSASVPIEPLTSAKEIPTAVAARIAGIPGEKNYFLYHHLLLQRLISPTSESMAFKKYYME